MGYLNETMGRPPRQGNGYGHGKAFFKILFGDFSSHLLIPPAFRRLIHRNLLCESLLRGPTGQCWNVKVEVDGNNMFFFREGWEKFAKDHSLEAYDFLTFNYDGKSQFDVKIYGKSTVEKLTFPALETPALRNKERDRRGGRGGTFVPNEPPRLFKRKAASLDMATTASASLSSVMATTTLPSRAQKIEKKVVSIGGLNSYGGLKAYNNVVGLGLPVCTEQSFANVVCSLKRPSGGGRRGGGALFSTCNAAGEIFRIAAIMNGLVLIGVAVGFVLLRIEASFEESE
ncbi:PetM of cytochrome b6/f complex subunit 7 [Dillenia turbinata]|uniref:PetM of cytochrome b6/f complex subunit 7 n=1 Tax=Dillenia turbinata TaxID=194707 RepID=A0AAN8VR81_9MAGN